MGIDEQKPEEGKQDGGGILKVLLGLGGMLPGPGDVINGAKALGQQTGLLDAMKRRMG